MEHCLILELHCSWNSSSTVCGDGTPVYAATASRSDKSSGNTFFLYKSMDLVVLNIQSTENLPNKGLLEPK